MTGRPSAIAEANYTLPLPLPYEVDAIITPSGQIVVQDWGIRVDGYSQMTRLEELGFFYRPRPQPRTYLEALRVDQARMGTKDDGSCLSAYDMPPYLQPFVTAPKDKDAAEAPRSAKLRRMSLSTMDPCTGMFFRLKTQLAIITEQVLMALDSPGAMSKSWEDIQGSITALDASLQQWLMLVPPTFDFRQPVRNEKYARERLTLGLFYYSAHLILGRPCLCRLDRRMTHQSAGSASFNYLRAQLCVHAALAMVNLLPDQPDPIALYRTGPWWCAVHFMMQAVIVLMLKMSYSAYHMPNEIERIMASAKKVTRWLRLMSKNDETAMNAWVIVTRNLTEVAMKNQLDVSDIETRPLSGKRRTCNVFGVGNPYSPQQNTSTQQPQYPHQDSTSQDQDGTGTSQTEQRDDTITPPWLQQHLYPHLNPTIPAYNPTLATTSAWSSAVHSVPVPTSTISTGAEFQGAWTDEPSPSFFTSLGDNSTLNPYAYTFPSTYTTMPQLTLAPSADFPPPWSQPVHPLPPDFPRPLSLRPTPPGPHWIDEQTDAVFENAMRDWERFQRDEARR
ncbi:hypothetical protein LTR04_001186 [Oleoguttula sp. CCFEE 6159]|nr:hypothetical protein LTR04_001186 [Oleoguttula sp. CCFEE 6159]